MFIINRKQLVRDIAWGSIRFFVAIAQSMPLGCARVLGRFLGRLAFIFLARHRSIALESLAIAFPKLPRKDQVKLAKEYFQYMPKWAFELLPYLKNPDHLKNISIEGKQHLDAGLAKGKGVIMINAHLGNFPLMPYKLAKSGYVTHVLLRHMRDPNADQYLFRLREKSSVKSIFSTPRQECVMNVIKALRRNEIVHILMDQNFGDGGVWVKFFDQLAATPTGAVVFALRTQAAVIPCYLVDENNGKHRLIIEPEVKMDVVENNEQSVLINTAKLTKIIEGWIRKYPDQWSWIHRRWKSRPNQNILSQPFMVEK